MKASRRGLLGIVGGAVAAMCTPLVMTNIGGCALQSGAPEESTAETEEALLSGVTAPTNSYLQAVMIRGCSGALLTREWAIVARHCMPAALDANGNDPATGQPIQIKYGSQTQRVTRMVHHPSTAPTAIDLTVVRVDSPFYEDIFGNFRRMVFPGNDGEIATRKLRCVGFQGTTLKYVDRQVTGFNSIKYVLGVGGGQSLDFRDSAGGPLTGPGDSGGVCYYLDPTGSNVYLAGVLSGSGMFPTDAGPSPTSTSYATSITSRNNDGTPTVREWLNRTVYHRIPGALVGGNNNKCVSIDSISYLSGVSGGAEFQDCAGSNPQNWDVEVQTTGWRLPPVSLTTPSAGKTWYLHSDGLPYHQAVSSSSSNSEWRFEVTGIVGHGDKCLEVENNSTLNGAKVRVHECSSSAAQSWVMYTTAPFVTNRGRFMRGSKCLSLSEGIGLFSRAQLWDCNNTDDQRWIVREDGTIRPLANQSFCLSHSEYSPEDHQLYLEHCDDHRGYGQWYFRGRLRRAVVAPYSQQCLEAASLGADNDDWAWDAPCGTGQGQEFEYFLSDKYRGYSD